MASLAPPLASIQSKGRLAPPRPVPAGSRPTKNPMFPLLNLVKVPLRVLSPPKATGMVGSVRSLKSTPMSDVKLADVIANKHLSPLSLKDFEVSRSGSFAPTPVAFPFLPFLPFADSFSIRMSSGIPRLQGVLGREPLLHPLAERVHARVQNLPRRPVLDEIATNRFRQH